MVLYDFKQRSDSELRVFKHYPDIADYFTSPVDFIYDKSMELTIDYDHIIDDKICYSGSDRQVYDKWFARKCRKEDSGKGET